MWVLVLTKILANAIESKGWDMLKSPSLWWVVPPLADTSEKRVDFFGKLLIVLQQMLSRGHRVMTQAQFLIELN